MSDTTAAAATAVTDTPVVVIVEEEEATAATTTTTTTSDTTTTVTSEEEEESATATDTVGDEVDEVTQSLEEILALGQGLDDEDYKAELDVLQNDPNSNLYSAVTFEELNLYVMLDLFCACVFDLNGLTLHCCSHPLYVCGLV